MSNLIPDYLNIDFNTLTSRLKTQISESEVFEDVDYEGSNISTLIELFAYIGELYTFYVNKIAKNQYLDTTETYENLHRLATFLGYYPTGYTSAEVVTTITVDLGSSSAVAFDELTLPAWYVFDSGAETNDGDKIYYTLTEKVTENITDTTGTYSFDVTLKQGEPDRYSFTGDDIIDNTLHLSSEKYDHGVYPYDIQSIGVYVDGEQWERISNFYNNVTPLTDTDNVFTFEFDKNERSIVKFSSYRNVPSSTAIIEIIVLKTYGADGSLGAGNLTDFDESQEIYTINSLTNRFELTDTILIRNETKSIDITEDYISMTNTNASRYASDKQTMPTIRHQARNNFSAQARNVSAEDYISYLENHSSIAKANAWGEQEENPGNTTYYYKAYMSIIPDEFGTSTLTTSAASASEWDGYETTSIPVASAYDETYEATIKSYLEPNKMINIYEIFIVPDLVYFRFDIGLKVKRTYNFTTVKEDVKNKLIYYFATENMNFNDTIDFKDIHNYIVDTSEVSSTDNFSSIRGLNNFIIRDIQTYSHNLSGSPIDIYDYNDNDTYPMYTDVNIDVVNDNNTIRPIKLGNNQFPILASDALNFINEG